MSDVQVAELFESIQGESSYAGLPCFFVRLAGCNLNCDYCDTPAACSDGDSMAIDDVVSACLASSVPLIEITGGEPLQQEGVGPLAEAICGACDKTVLVETNGTCDISRIPDGAIAIVDVKTPGSGMAGTFDEANLDRLRSSDEVKFVLCDRRDYDWAVEFVCEHELSKRCSTVLFSPAWDQLDPARLAGWLLADGLPVRLQVQLHKVLNFR
ncbi:MAG: 4Fe-4S cluster-binding domain-containing protein [Kiritimatiellae bacterium]|nr:4Fe-4S cluster-binding domain-containing protein [Kiritimatiellia bacterium]